MRTSGCVGGCSCSLVLFFSLALGGVDEQQQVGGGGGIEELREEEGLKMIGSIVTGALTLVLGYAYPAYDCYKTVELNRPEVEQLRFWCQYWILLAVLTVLERVGENFVSWLPMYSEAKLAFIVYLWYPKTRGTAYVYESFFKPYIAKHETEIDRNLLELRTRAGDMAVLYFQRVANYVQTRSYEILQYIASQSESQRRRPQAQQQQQRPPPPRTRQVNPAPPPVPAPSAPPMPPQPAQAQVPPTPPRPPVPVAPLGAVPPAQPQPPPAPGAAAINGPQNTEAMQVDPPRTSTSGAPPSLPPEETLIEEAIRLTRGRLRRRLAGGSGPPSN
ncbi:HVA22-like protein i [Dichanthelium oligosanthes]|uniref:HVA22-like protein n=1 Tax=Dichanthelium oligosanthes TaxID=888268 RepID=A0A1E5UQQ8_9POAL|nr:HVA22-like protein i [Dichanthelium oligosanthes]